ncbi:creatininase family protein [Larkinella soli]|uniref:creatininase family protein n=1 Tax=Larkinella soli TaxID=1770527 RepID=UPI000FFC86BC|nr:creatininase family protein [Larkinella soli]
MKKARLTLLLAVCLAAFRLSAQTPANPLWHEQKVKNYLPHMTVPEVRELLTRTDMVIIPIAALEQHGLHLPIGTDYLNGVERAKLVAQKTDVLVAPVLLVGQSPYHMEFPGTISLSAETIVKVHLEAVQSLLQHGFKRFLILNAHGGNKAICTYLVDRINQETAGIAVELAEAVAPFRTPSTLPKGKEKVFDRHAGVSETSSSLYLIPNLVRMDQAETARLFMPKHMEAMVPEVLDGDPTANLVFLAEGLKAKQTGKKTSAAEMSTTGVWGIGDLKAASAERGRDEAERFVDAAVKFIEKWKSLRPKN